MCKATSSEQSQKRCLRRRRVSCPIFPAVGGVVFSPCTDPLFIVPTRLRIGLNAVAAPQFNPRSQLVGDRQSVGLLAAEESGAALHTLAITQASSVLLVLMSETFVRGSPVNVIAHNQTSNWVATDDAIGAATSRVHC
jgi:hypothetical protein